MPALFDSITGEKLKPSPAPPRASQMLYHSELPPIVVAVESTAKDPLSLPECKIALAAKVKQKVAEGWLEERPHGQHPHSFDAGRLHMQKTRAEAGDASAKEAIEAKKNAPRPVVAPVVSEGVQAEVERLKALALAQSVALEAQQKTTALEAQIAALQAAVEQLVAEEKRGPGRPRKE